LVGIINFVVFGGLIHKQFPLHFFGFEVVEIPFYSVEFLFVPCFICEILQLSFVFVDISKFKNEFLRFLSHLHLPCQVRKFGLFLHNPFYFHHFPQILFLQIKTLPNRDIVLLGLFICSFFFIKFESLETFVLQFHWIVWTDRIEHLIDKCRLVKLVLYVISVVVNQIYVLCDFGVEFQRPESQVL